MKKFFTSWATWIVAGVIVLVIIAAVRSAPEGSLQTFTGSFVIGYEGDFTKLSYTFSYPSSMFFVTGEGRKITLTELENQHVHGVEFFWNGAAGFESPLQFWNEQNHCNGCTEATGTISIRDVKNVSSFTNTDGTEQWFVGAYKDFFVMVNLVEPVDAARSVVEGFRLTAEKTNTPQELVEELDANTQEELSGSRTLSLKVFFMNQKLAPADTCKEVVPVMRTVPHTQGVARAALELLLQGPTRADLGEGYLTNIPEGSKLNSLAIVNGEARVDFNSITESGGGSCSMAARMAQIVETLKQFPTVKSVKLSIDGRTGDIFQP